MTSEPMVHDLRDLLEERAALVRDPNTGFEVLAARVVATPQRHRRWLPMLLPPETKQGVLSMFTATRVAAAMLVLALISTGILSGWALLPAPLELAPAVTSQSPSPSAEASVEPDEDFAAEAEATAESMFVATGQLYRFEPGEEPTNLAVAADKSSLYADTAAGATYMVSADGYRHTLGETGHSYTRDSATGNLDPTSPQGKVTQSPALQDPLSVARGGEDALIHDTAGRLWVWADYYETAPGYTKRNIEPARLPLETVTFDRTTYDIYAYDEATGNVQLYGQNGRGVRLKEPVIVADRRGRSEAIAMYADGFVYVVTDAEVERYRDGTRSTSWRLEDPPGGSPDYRFIDGIRRDGKGELWLFDAAGERLVVFDKASGKYLDSWVPLPSDGDLGDLQGFVVEGDGSGNVEAIRWLTPDAIMRSALTDRSVVVEAGGRSFAHGGVLEPSSRDAEPRPLSFVKGALSLEADSLLLTVAGKSADARGEVHVDGFTSTHYGDDLELTWFENGVEQRIYVHLKQDDTHWWIDDIWAYDGEKDGDWLFFEDLETLTRTPLGLSLEGDLRVPNLKASRKKYTGTAMLEIEGMRLTAPSPDDRPAPLSGCEPPASEIWASRSKKGNWSIRAEDAAKWRRIAKMSPTEAEEALQEMGLCYRFSYTWWTKPYKDDRLNTYVHKHGDELRCSAPESGQITSIMTVPDVDHSQEMVRVGVELRAVREGPEPPPYGTDCEPLVPS